MLHFTFRWHTFCSRVWEILWRASSRNVQGLDWDSWKTTTWYCEYNCQLTLWFINVLLRLPSDVLLCGNINSGISLGCDLHDKNGREFCYFADRETDREYLTCETMNHCGFFVHSTFLAVLSMVVIITQWQLLFLIRWSMQLHSLISNTYITRQFIFFVLCSSLFIVDMSTLKTILSMQFMLSQKTLKYTSKLNGLRWYKLVTNTILQVCIIYKIVYCKI